MSKIKFFLKNFEEIVCSMALTITIFSVLINTIMGWVVDRRYGQLEEIAIMGFVWVTFLGISVVYKKGSHIKIEFIIDTLPKPIKLFVNSVVDLGLILFCFYLCQKAIILTVGAIEKTTPLLHLSYFYIDIPVVLGFSLMALHSIIRFVSQFKNLKGGNI